LNEYIPNLMIGIRRREEGTPLHTVISTPPPRSQELVRGTYHICRLNHLYVKKLLFSQVAVRTINKCLIKLDSVTIKI